MQPPVANRVGVLHHEEHTVPVANLGTPVALWLNSPGATITTRAPMAWAAATVPSVEPESSTRISMARTPRWVLFAQQGRNSAPALRVG